MSAATRLHLFSSTGRIFSGNLPLAGDAVTLRGSGTDPQAYLRTTGAGTRVDAVAGDDVDALGDNFQAIHIGFVIMTTDDAIPPSRLVALDSEGLVRAAVSTDIPIGTSIAPATTGGAGEKIEVFFNPSHVPLP